MISLSGVGVSGLDMLNLQNTAILKSYKFSDKTVAKQMEMYNIMFNIVYNTKDGESAQPEMAVKLKEWMAKQDTATLKETQLLDGRDQTFYTVTEKTPTENGTATPFITNRKIIFQNYHSGICCQWR